MSGEISITFTCPDCGTRLSWPDDATDETKLACGGCGKDAGTYKDLRDKARSVAKAKIDETVRKIFKV